MMSLEKDTFLPKVSFGQSTESFSLTFQKVIVSLFQSEQRDFPSG